MAAKKPENKSKTKKTATKKTATRQPPAKQAAKQPAKPGPKKARAGEATKKTTAAKTTAAKTTAAKSTAKKPAIAKAKVVSIPRSEATVTTVVANVDAGFGNELFIRGVGGDLSWETGVKMECVGAAEWRFTTTTAEDLLEVKFLLNDDAWSEGENVVVPPGTELVVEPSF